MKKLIIIAVLLLVAGGAGYWYWHSSGQTQSSFRTAEVTRGRLVSTIGATGTLEPEEVVDIGAQVAGRIISLGIDPSDPKKTINWGSSVEGPPTDSQGNPIFDKDGEKKLGTPLAQIDDTLYEAQYISAKADLAKSEADLERVQADIDVKSAQKNQALKDWDRAEKLYPKSMSKAEFDAAEATKDIAIANFKVGKATEKVNIELVKVALASKKIAKTNLDYTKITAPTKGVIIDRRVNIGQTVVASLSAPSLFLLAKDLSKMEVWATVNEADVGKTRIGQAVTFTVDAYPGEIFKGVVKAQGDYPARLNASMTQNVVTYTVVVQVDNPPSKNYPKGKLWPYLTANLQFIVNEKTDALLVPNAALRWVPARHQIHPEVRDAYAKSKSKKKSAGEIDAVERGYLWVMDEGFVRFLHVKIGASDGINTEILGVSGGGELAEHTAVVTGESRAQSADASDNPFLPKMPFGGKKKTEKE